MVLLLVLPPFIAEVASDQDIIYIHEIIDEIEREVFKEMNINLVIHMDPVVVNDERANELKQTIQEFLGRLSKRFKYTTFVWYGVRKAVMLYLTLRFHSGLNIRMNNWNPSFQIK